MNLDIQKQQIIDDIHERIDRVKCSCREMESSGMETLIALADDQGERLGNIKLHLKSIDATLVNTKNDLNRMKRFRRRVFDLFCIPFNRLQEQKILPKHFFNVNKKQNLSLRKNYSIAKIPERKSTVIDPTNSNAYETEIDEAIEELETVTSRLIDIANGINSELVRQDITLKDIHVHVIKTTNSIEKQKITVKQMD